MPSSLRNHHGCSSKRFRYRIWIVIIIPLSRWVYRWAWNHWILFFRSENYIREGKRRCVRGLCRGNIQFCLFLEIKRLLLRLELIFFGTTCSRRRSRCSSIIIAVFLGFKKTSMLCNNDYVIIISLLWTSFLPILQCFESSFF